MLQLAFSVLVLALVAAVLGFGGIIDAAVEASKILFGAFIMLFFLSVALDRERV